MLCRLNNHSMIIFRTENSSNRDYSTVLFIHDLCTNIQKAKSKKEQIAVIKTKTIKPANMFKNTDASFSIEKSIATIKGRTIVDAAKTSALKGSKFLR